MTHEELNLENLNYDLNRSVQFKVRVNMLYNELVNTIHYDYEKNYGYGEVDCIEEKRKDIFNKLKRFIFLIWDNLDYLETLSMEDRYMILNCVKLGKCIKLDLAIELADVEEFKELEESYKNSR